MSRASWVHKLKTPKHLAATVAARLTARRPAVVAAYNAAAAAATPPGAPLPAADHLVVAVRGPARVDVAVVGLAGPGALSVNALSDAIAGVLEPELGVQVPYWS